MYLHFDIAETDPTPLKKCNAKISSFLPLLRRSVTDQKTKNKSNLSIINAKEMVFNLFFRLNFSIFLGCLRYNMWIMQQEN